MCVDELDCREEVSYIRKILEMGTGADRQLRVFDETKDLKESGRLHHRGD